MTRRIRLVYLKHGYLNDYEEKRLCYLPMCRKCKAWLLYQVAIVISKNRCSKRKYYCLRCASRWLGKGYILNMLRQHITKLSKSNNERDRRRTKEEHIKAYQQLKRYYANVMVEN
jgi:Zn-finger nucleic acid-binding protein